MKLNFSEAIEGICSIIDYMLALKGKESICADLNSFDELTSSEENILNEIEIDLERVVMDLVNNLLIAKGILNYDDEDCDYENIQDEYQIILEKGTIGYQELLEKYNLNQNKFEEIKIK